MTSEPYKWGPWQATEVFFKTIYGDFYGDRAARARLARQPLITDREATVDSRVLSFMVGEDEADDGPHIPILFLHGTPGSALCWKGFLLEPEGYRVIALDRPGFGRSAAGAPELEEDVGPLGELVERIASESGKVLVGGHSLGAGVAARLAAEHREAIRGLVLMGGSLDPGLERILPVQRLFAVPPWSGLLTRSLRNSNRELLQYTAFLERLGPELAQVTCRVVVIHSRDDRLVPYANVHYAEAHFTGAAALRIVTLEQGGHFINRSRIGEIKRALRETFT